MNQDESPKPGTPTNTPEGQGEEIEDREWDRPPRWTSIATASAAIRYARAMIGRHGGRIIVEIDDPQATPTERQTLFDAVAWHHKTVPTPHSTTKEMKLHTHTADAQHETVEEALARCLAEYKTAKNPTAQQAPNTKAKREDTRTARRGAITRALTRGKGGAPMLIGAMNAEHWIDDGSQMPWLIRVITRNPRLRALLVRTDESSDGHHQEGRRRVRVLRTREAFEAYRKETNAEDALGESLLETISHDIAMEGGQGWRTAAAETWHQSYVFRTDCTDPYQRSMTAQGGYAVVQHLAKRMLGHNGLADLAHSATSSNPALLGTQIREATLERRNTQIHINIKLHTPAPGTYRRQRGPALAWPDPTGLPHDAYGTCGLDCVGLLAKDKTMRETAERFEADSAERWNGQGMTLTAMKSVLNSANIPASLALSGGETHVHCRAGGMAILALESRTHGNHALLCQGDTIYDPGGFIGLGRLWVEDDPDVQLLGAVLILDDQTCEQIRNHTVHFIRRTRPPNARQRRNVWDS